MQLSFFHLIFGLRKVKQETTALQIVLFHLTPTSHCFQYFQLVLWNDNATLLLSIVLLGDPSDPKSQGERRDDSAKLKYAGSKQRLDDDQSDCADDITRLCPEIPKGNNFALLVCLQDKAKVWFVATVNPYYSTLLKGAACLVAYLGWPFNGWPFKRE